MIPADRVNPRALSNLIEYALEELRRAKNERQDLEQNWMAYNLAYRALPERSVKDFPFKGAANLVIPVIATDIDTIFARLMSHMFSPDNLFSCSATRPDMLTFAPRLQEFLQTMQNTELDLYNPAADWLLELTKLGTGVLKTRYSRRMQKVYEYREPQGIQQGPFSTIARQLRLMVED